MVIKQSNHSVVRRPVDSQMRPVTDLGNQPRVGQNIRAHAILINVSILRREGESETTSNDPPYI